jgi:hypothetical protein
MYEDIKKLENACKDGTLILDDIYIRTSNINIEFTNMQFISFSMDVNNGNLIISDDDIDIVRSIDYNFVINYASGNLFKIHDMRGNKIMLVFNKDISEIIS